MSERGEDPFVARARWLRDRVVGGAALVRARLALRGCELGSRVACFGRVRVTNEGRIEIGDGVFFLEGFLPNELIAHPGARISLGAGSALNHGVSIESRARVTIGKRCMLASMVRISDSVRGNTAPITIEDDVWLAHGAIVEPGVTIGAGSAVSAGSVVVKDVPPGKLAIGNPARAVPLVLRGEG